MSDGNIHRKHIGKYSKHQQKPAKHTEFIGFLIGIFIGIVEKKILCCDQNLSENK